LSVVDSVGTEVGIPVGLQGVARQIGDLWVFFDVLGPSGLYVDDGATLYFETRDCSGPSWMETVGVIRRASIVGDTAYFAGSLTKTIAQGGPNKLGSLLTLHSAGAEPCRIENSDTVNFFEVGNTSTASVSGFGLLPPFFVVAR
jgi:hypothetical protein